MVWTWERLSERRAELFESSNPGGAQVGLVSIELSSGMKLLLKLVLISLKEKGECLLPPCLDSCPLF
jgi:hypothetical protein